MDVRVELVNRMDAAAAAMDVVRLGALARLNWNLIDAEVLQFTASRAAQAQAGQQAATQQQQLARQRQRLADARSNYVVGQAAIAIGANPSAYMSSPNSAATPAVDPQVQLFAMVHQMLSRAAMLRGAPDPEVAPILAARAKELLAGQVDAGELVQLVLSAAPPAQRQVIAMTAQLPGVAQQLFPPIVRGSAVWAVPLLDLQRLVPDAQIAGPPASPMASPALPAAPSVPAPAGSAWSASLVETLLAQAMTADAQTAEALYLRALDAADKTPRIDDDITVLFQLARASGNKPPSAAILRRAAALVGTLARRPERRDDVAKLLGWLVFGAIQGGLTAELAPGLVAACRAVLSAPLADAAAVQLTGALVELLVRSGALADAGQAVEAIAPRATDPALGKALAMMRTRVRQGAPPTTGAGGFAEGLVPPDVRTALGGSLVFEDLRGDFTVALRRLPAHPDAVVPRAIVLAASGQAAAAQRLLRPVVESKDARPDLRSAALHAFRYAQRINGQLVPGGDGGADEYLKYAQRNFADLGGTPPPSPAARADCEALADLASCLTLRTTTSIRGRRDDAMLRATLGTSQQETFDDAARASAAATSPAGSRSPVWVALAAADLHRRDGDAMRAQEMIAAARAAAGDDVHARGEIALALGHWAACAVESPLTLGLCLEAGATEDSSIDTRVERREWASPDASALAAAGRVYDDAAAAFERAGSPRGLAAVALSRAGVAALGGDHRRAGELAAHAEREFAEVGDELGRRLARTHTAIAATAIGAPLDRDGIREIGAWAISDGSLSFGIGCARLLSRSGRRALYRDGDLERSLALHTLAYDLLAATPLDMLAAQALVDQANALRIANDFDAISDALSRAASQLANATLGAPADLGLRRALVLQQAWNIENQRSDADGLDRIAQQITAVLSQLDAATGKELSTELLLARLRLTHTAQVSPAVAALYRARDLDADPASTPDTRAATWQGALAAARGLPPNDGLLYEGLAEAARGEGASASAVFQRLFDRPDPVAQAQQAVPGAPRPPDADAILVRRDALALASFLRARDTPRARAAYDRLVARDAGWAQHDDPPWNALASVGELRSAEGDPDAALVAYQAALDAVETRRSLLTDDSLKRGFVDTSPIHAMYVGAGRAALARDPARAFALVERGRARALLDLASDRRSTATAWRAYNAQRGLVHNQLALETARPTPDGARLAALRARLASLDAARPNVPTIADQMATATLADVAARLPHDAVVLEYAFADDWLVAWAVTRAGMVAHRTVQIRTPELRRAALGFRARCGAGRDVTADGRYLAELLLAPFADAIRLAAHVVVVPTDALHIVPFHAMPFGAGMLLDAAAVSYAPSASLVHALGAGPLAAGPLVIVGNPAEMSFTDENGAVQPLRELPGAGAEARRIAAAYPGARPALVGPTATLDAVRAGLTVARVVHLATHAVLSARSPWLSTIALANGAALDLATLSGLELQADLVTLSACDTARGTLGKSDETLGFARGLIAAGARRTLVSLWPVSDVATCELMTVFYRELAAGRPVVQALRTAQLHVRDLPGDAIAALVDGLVAEDGALASAGRRHATLADVPEPAPPAEGFAHPSFWAPFVLIGL